MGHTTHIEMECVQITEGQWAVHQLVVVGGTPTLWCGFQAGGHAPAWGQEHTQLLRLPALGFNRHSPGRPGEEAGFRIQPVGSHTGLNPQKAVIQLNGGPNRQVLQPPEMA